MLEFHRTPEWPIGVAAHGTLADAVYRHLRDAIVNGELAPGDRVREVPLSKQLGVSTTPIREALRRLEREGLVSSQPRRGTVVANPGPDEVEGLYELREVLECHAIRRVGAARDRDVSRLEALLQAAAGLLSEADQARYNTLDIQFHRALCELGGNLPLAEMAECIHRRIQAVRVRCAVYLPGRPAVSHREHESILAAVKDGDGRQAEARLRAHIRSIRDAVVSALRTAARVGGR